MKVASIRDQALAAAQSKVDTLSKPPPKTYRLLRVADLDGMPPMEWCIYNVLPSEGSAGIFGASGSGKSFVSLSMLAAIAEGERWFGYRVKARPVLLVVLEGEAGFRKRVKAWEHENGRPFPDSVRFLFGEFNLLNPEDVLALAAAVATAGGVGVVAIDTLNRAAPGADENGAQDMSRILEAVKSLQSMVGGMVVLVHHTGKDLTKGMRGHSSLGAALDAAIEVIRNDDRREWKVAKSKDGEDGAVHPFRLQLVDLGEDEDGEPVTSCVVEPLQTLDETPRLKLPKGGNQKIVYEALGPLFRESYSLGRAGAPPTRPCITLADAIAGTRDKLVCDSARRTERARQALTGLVSSGILSTNEDWLWFR